MGMLINPYQASASGPITVGNTAARTANIATSANNQIGVGWQVTQSGWLNYITITGNGSSATSVDYRLCIYAATSGSVWGALLAQTADQNGLGIGEIKKVALITPIFVNAGDWIAPTVQANASMSAGSSSGLGGERSFSDTFSDGPAATASATSSFSSANHCIYASTL